MSDLRRAWTVFRSRHSAEQRRLILSALQRARTEGPRAAIAWIRGSGAIARDADRYREWCRAHTPDAADVARMRAASELFPGKPTISIITATYNTDSRWLEAAADSVLGQAYPYWQWSIADDGSTDGNTCVALDRLARRDPRIVLTHAEANAGISAASNLALAEATGDFIALLDHDDALLPHALFRIVERLNMTPEADVVYSDEDKLDETGARVDPYFKPDWSPDLFRSSMYACHLLVIRRALVEQVGGFRGAFDFAQDYDLLLRVIEQTDRIAHVPDVLYHWRKVPASTAFSASAKPTAHDAGARALQAHLDRQGIAGRILGAGPPGLYRVKYDIAGSPRVSILIPTRDAHAAELARLFGALAHETAYRTFDVVLVSSNGAVPRDVPDGLEIRGVRAERPFNFAGWINHGARSATGDHLLVLHDDVTPRDPEWLAAMLELSSQPWIGAVGAKLFDAQGRLADIGLVLGLRGLASSPFAGFAGETVGYYSGANCIRNYAAVSSACLMTRADVFQQVGGFDEATTQLGAAVDYGLQVIGRGLRVAFTPYATLTTGAAVLDTAPSADEVQYLHKKWGSRLEIDPYYNPNLSEDYVDYRIR